MTQPQPSGGFEWTQASWGPALQCRPLLDHAPHLFTVANVQLRGDEHEWDAIARTLDVERARVRLLHQVHGTRVSVVRRGELPPHERPEADIAVSDDPASAVAVRVADCAPILLADRRRSVVGAAHAGWRGTLQRVAAEAVHAMTREFGSRPTDLVAAIGPCLGPCCGELGLEVLQEFRAAGHDDDSLARWFMTGPSGRPYLNLWRANREQLENAGLQRERIYSADLCTKTHADVFHSYRAHGIRAGRMVGIIRTGDSRTNTAGATAV